VLFSHRYNLHILLGGGCVVVDMNPLRWLLAFCASTTVIGATIWAREEKKNEKQR